MNYSNNFNEPTNNDDLATFTELFAMSDDPLNVTSPTVNMTSSADTMTSSNGNMTSGDDSAALNTTTETSQQAYDLSKLDNATLEQLISSVCSLCSGDATVHFLFVSTKSFLLKFIKSTINFHSIEPDNNCSLVYCS